MSVDMSDARDLIRRLELLLDAVDGVSPDKRAPSGEKARISGDLLYAVHCADLVRAEVLSQYHIFKGREDVPLVVAA